jgi:hypothetical protein
MSNDHIHPIFQNILNGIGGGSMKVNPTEVEKIVVTDTKSEVSSGSRRFQAEVFTAGVSTCTISGPTADVALNCARARTKTHFPAVEYVGFEFEA